MFKKGIIIRNTIIFLSLLVCGQEILAAVPTPKSEVPSSVNPSVIGPYVQPVTSPTPEALQPLNRPSAQPPSALGPEASKLKFKLTKIILEGNHVYSDKVLLSLYQDKLNKTITVAQLQDIVQSLTNYYRNNGYILSRAVIPPQHVKSGVVQIRIIEGYIDRANVIGTPKGSRALVAAYGNRITQSRPLQIKDMEYELFLANEVPGGQTRAILEPSKTETGASDLNLSTQSQLVNAYLSYDNYGTRYIGPQEYTANIQGNSLFLSGDVTRITYVNTVQSNELKYKDLNYEMPLGTKGWRVAFDGNQAQTNPQFTLAPLDVVGNATNYNAVVRYPAIRSRSANLTLEGAYNYLNSRTTQFNGLFLLYSDRVRSLRIGGTYNFADRFLGSNVISASLIQGIPVLGGTTNAESFTTSRFGATTKYTRVTLQATRLQQLFWKFSLYGLVKGQYAFQPLLASEQFGFGGSQLGRGYDPAEIIGDRGAAGSLELRLSVAPSRWFLQAAQIYVFYDAGESWNLRNVQGPTTKQDATSTGAGIRFSMSKFVSGNLMWTQPLSKKVAALEQIGNGSLPRVFFSISASV